jgi:PIN domain nuclease of toxin-antitoxin system
MSSVNWCEVVQKSLRRDVDVATLRQYLADLGFRIIAFDADDAERAARLWSTTHHLGLSLADRACLAMALRTGATVLTADRAWSQLQVGVTIQPIR